MAKEYGFKDKKDDQVVDLHATLAGILKRGSDNREYLQWYEEAEEVMASRGKSYKLEKARLSDEELQAIKEKFDGKPKASTEKKPETKKEPDNMAAREKLADKEMGLKREGKEIILPEGMGFDTAIEWLMRMKEEDERKVAVMADIDCSPLDGLLAFQKALKDEYGWTALVPTPGFFGSRPPIQISIQTGPKGTDTVQAAYGRVEIPGIDGFMSTGFNTDNGKLPSFIISGEVKRKHEKIVNSIIAKTRKYLAEESLYKGKAIKVSFDWLNDKENRDGEYDILKDAPRFMEPSLMGEKDLIFPQKVMDGLNVGLFTPIEQAEACRQHKIPLKRGVLLHGPYGTGKTLTATVTATKAVLNGWTFIYLDSVRDLRQGLLMAAKYAPAVVFAEDIDRVMSGDRSLSMDGILNILDGVDTKGAEVITVLTTNHLDQINPTLLRPGRLDTLIEVTPPDAAAAIKLVKLYARDLLEDGVDLTKLGALLEGKIPAMIREVTERAKIAAIRSQKGPDIKGKVTQADLIAAANALEPHSLLLTPKETGMQTVNLKDIKVVIPGKGKVKGSSLNA